MAETLQDRFEAWMASSNYPEIADIALERLPDGNYKSQLTFAAWQGWQGASREALDRQATISDEAVEYALATYPVGVALPDRERELMRAALTAAAPYIGDVAAERERCAKIAEARQINYTPLAMTEENKTGWNGACREIARAIRQHKEGE